MNREVVSYRSQISPTHVRIDTKHTLKGRNRRRRNRKRKKDGVFRTWVFGAQISIAPNWGLTGTVIEKKNLFFMILITIYFFVFTKKIIVSENKLITQTQTVTTRGRRWIKREKMG